MGECAGHGAQAQCLPSVDAPSPHAPKIMEWLGGMGVTQVACASDHCLALTWRGRLYAWGCGFLLGAGDACDHRVPRRVRGFGHQRVVQVACANKHTAVATGMRAASAGACGISWVRCARARLRPLLGRCGPRVHLGPRGRGAAGSWGLLGLHAAAHGACTARVHRDASCLRQRLYAGRHPCVAPAAVPACGAPRSLHSNRGWARLELGHQWSWAARAGSRAGWR